jgi:two-component sensor histidine kinase
VTIGKTRSNGLTKLFVYTLSHDSLLLNIIDPSVKIGENVRTRFVDKINTSKDISDLTILQSRIDDLDGDGNNEFIGGIMGGFSLMPRIHFIYDDQNDKFTFSPRIGTWFDITEIADINRDGKKEIFAGTYSISNFPDSLKFEFDDHSAWIMTFNHNFNFLFRPVPYRGKYIVVFTYPVSVDGRYRLISVIYQRIQEGISPRLVLSDLNGKKLKERELPDSNLSYQLYIPEDEQGKIFLTANSGNIGELDGNLNIIREKTLPGKNFYFNMHLDFDLDGKTEHLCFVGFSESPTVFRKDFSDPVKLDFPITRNEYKIGLKTQKNKPPLIHIQQNDSYFLFNYGKNPYYFLKFIFYISIYIFILSIFLLSQYLQRNILRQRYETEKQISELQLEILKSQLDPHFVFNLISSVSVTILQKKPEETHRNILQLANLIRSCIATSDKLSRTLAEELNFTVSYLELVKVLMEGQLQYEVKLDPDIDLQTMVPRMVVQGHVENAVKHGIRPKPGGGKIWITADLKENFLVIEIADNGIGRKYAADINTTTTGKGIEMMDHFFRLFNKYNKQKIAYKIEDLLTSENQPAGTRLIISIPLKFNYQLFKHS